MAPRKKKPPPNGAHLHVPRACPRCAMPSDTTAPLDAEAKPIPGAVMVCQRCGMLEMVRESGQVSVITADEWSALDDADRVKLLNLEDGRRRVMGA